MTAADVQSPGQPVTNHQVIAFAKPACSLCHGAGWYHAHTPKPEDRLCGCALRAFTMAYSDRIHRTAEGVFWIPGQSPEEVIPDLYADFGR